MKREGKNGGRWERGGGGCAKKFKGSHMLFAIKSVKHESVDDGCLADGLVAQEDELELRNRGHDGSFCVMGSVLVHFRTVFYEFLFGLGNLNS